MRDEETIKRRIEELPKGSLVVKTRNGRDYLYLKYREGTKTVTDYIGVYSAETYADYLGKIEERRKLERELRAIRNGGNGMQKTAGSEQARFLLNVTLSEDMDYSAVNKLQKRDCYKEIERYLSGPCNGTVCAVAGLKQTGKTTLMKQAMADMARNGIRSAYVIPPGRLNGFEDLIKDLKTLREMGVKTVFVDEITWLNDTLDNVIALSKSFAPDMKIVFSGTDSLEMNIISQGEIYRELEMIDTTVVSFQEFVKLTEYETMDDYIRYGGTLMDKKARSAFSDPVTALRYMDSAIIDNVIHFLRKDEMISKQDEAEVKNALYRVIDDELHRFSHIDTETFEQRFKREPGRGDVSSGFMVAKRDDFDIAEVNAVLDAAFGYQKHNEAYLNSKWLGKAEEYLVEAGILQREIGTRVEANNTFTEWGKSGDSTLPHYIVMPGLRYQLTVQKVKTVLQTDQYKNLPDNTKEAMLKFIEAHMLGQQMEEIAAVHIYNHYCDEYNGVSVRKLYTGAAHNAEADIAVIYNSETDEKPTVDLFEVKHNYAMNSKMANHILSSSFLALLGNHYNVRNKVILYNGDNVNAVNGAKYRNINDFLMTFDLEGVELKESTNSKDDILERRSRNRLPELITLDEKLTAAAQLKQNVESQKTGTDLQVEKQPDGTKHKN